MAIKGGWIIGAWVRLLSSYCICKQLTECVFSVQGDTADAFYIVEDGAAKITRIDPASSLYYH